MQYEYDALFPICGLWQFILHAYGNILMGVHGFDYLKKKKVLQELCPNTRRVACLCTKYYVQFTGILYVGLFRGFLYQ